MRRDEFLKLTGFTAAAYQGYQRTIAAVSLVNVDEVERKGWRTFDRSDVFETCLIVALAPAVGGQAEAYRRVFELPSKRFEKLHGWLADPSGDDVWALSFAPKMAPGSPEPLAKPYGWSISSFERLLSDPANLGLVDGTQLPAADYAKYCGDMAMINLSKIMREIEDRARDAGIHFQSDFSKGEDE